jgi:hypothetical protein
MRACPRLAEALALAAMALVGWLLLAGVLP